MVKVKADKPYEIEKVEDTAIVSFKLGKPLKSGAGRIIFAGIMFFIPVSFLAA